MSNLRIFKIPRRRPHIVDLYAPLTQGLDTLGYRVKWAQNFDAAITAIINSSNVGFLDSNVNRMKIETQPTTGTDVRIVFDPTTYSIDDTKSFWLQYAQVVGAAETLVSAPTLILPDTANKGIGVVTIQGNAPSGATSANSLQLDFPFLMQNFEITNNDAANTLFVSTEQSGPETAVGPKLGFYGYSTIYASQGSIWVRSGGAAVVNFSATSTLAFPR